jgi:hypothetical protein
MYNVYLISCGDVDNKKYKIGYTKNAVEKRVKQLKTGNFEEINIEQVFTSKWGSKIESILHRNYSDYKLTGEWFSLTENHANNFLKECQNLDNFLEDWFKNSTFKNPKTILR